MVWAGDLDAFCDDCSTTHKINGLNSPSLFEFDPTTTNGSSDLEASADRDTKVAMFEHDNVSPLTEVFSVTLLLGALGTVALIALSLKLVFMVVAMTKPHNPT